MDAYPNGRYISSAKNKIEEMTFQCCKTIDDYKMYLQKYPLGKYKDEAEKILQKQFCGRIVLHQRRRMNIVIILLNFRMENTELKLNVKLMKEGFGPLYCLGDL